MASLEERLPENVEGELFVDSTCIDCETCMIVAPSVFAESDRQLSFVHHQPASETEWHRAKMALIACPTASIGTVHKADAKAAASAFPDEIEPGIYYCGYASEDSFGASSYLIRRPEGNLLVDSPRAAKPLLARIESLGGVKTMFLTHRDDVADHEKFRERFGCERVMHRDDARGLEMERRIDGSEPVEIEPGLTVIPVPGHTRGSAVLRYGNVLFTGDHLWGNEDGRLGASRGVAWHSWTEQIRSMEKLLAVDFDTVLPGHGRPWKAGSVAEAREALGALVARMKSR